MGHMLDMGTRCFRATRVQLPDKGKLPKLRAFCQSQFVKDKGFLMCDVRVATHTQNCPRNGPLKARLMA